MHSESKTKIIATTPDTELFTQNEELVITKAGATDKTAFKTEWRLLKFSNNIVNRPTEVISKLLINKEKSAEW